jgi:hypothetical protein
MTKPPMYKPIDPKIKLYYVFKLTSILYALYDIELIMPIKYGSLQIIESTVASIKKTVQGSRVIYFDPDLVKGFVESDIKTRTHNK